MLEEEGKHQIGSEINACTPGGSDDPPELPQPLRIRLEIPVNT